MNFRLSALLENSVEHGPGNRFVIYMQGCLHRCKGCHMPQTWQINGGEKVYTEDIEKRIASTKDIVGITLTGGDPFIQPKAALELARFAHSKGLTVWCFTGYKYEWIQMWDDNRKDLLREIDVLVEGKFDEKRRFIDVKKTLEKGEVVLVKEEEMK